MRIRATDLRRLCTALVRGGAVVAATALAPSASFAQGCAMCATYLSNGQDPRADAFKVSIMFLMAMPFTVVGVAGGWILWMYRRHRSSRPSLHVLHVARGEAS